MKEYYRFKDFLSESMHSDVVNTVRGGSTGLLFHLLDQFSLMNGFDVEDPASDRVGMSDFMSDLSSITPSDEYEMDSLQAESLIDRISESEMIYILVDLIENPEKLKGRMRAMTEELSGFTVEGAPLIDYLKQM